MEALKISNLKVGDKVSRMVGPYMGGIVDMKINDVTVTKVNKNSVSVVENESGVLYRYALTNNRWGTTGDLWMGEMDYLMSKEEGQSLKAECDELRLLKDLVEKSGLAEKMEALRILTSKEVLSRSLLKSLISAIRSSLETLENSL